MRATERVRTGPRRLQALRRGAGRRQRLRRVCWLRAACARGCGLLCCRQAHPRRPSLPSGSLLAVHLLDLLHVPGSAVASNAAVRRGTPERSRAAHAVQPALRSRTLRATSAPPPHSQSPGTRPGAQAARQRAHTVGLNVTATPRPAQCGSAHQAQVIAAQDVRLGPAQPEGVQAALGVAPRCYAPERAGVPVLHCELALADGPHGAAPGQRPDLQAAAARVRAAVHASATPQGPHVVLQSSPWSAGVRSHGQRRRPRHPGASVGR